MMADSAPVNLAKEGAEPVAGRWPAATNPTREHDKKIVKAAGSELFHCLNPDDRRGQP
ncbi:MAG: hypothetical protein R2864_08030 [Syntrophotaleaceae bacterium]